MANLKRTRTLVLYTLRSGDSPLMILIFMEGVSDEIKSKQAYKRDRTLIYLTKENAVGRHTTTKT